MAQVKLLNFVLKYGTVNILMYFTPLNLGSFAKKQTNKNLQRQ